MYQKSNIIVNPVTIRFLDPPLHEFVPQTEEDIKKFVENIFHKYHIENEKNHDTVHVLSVHTSKDDAVAEWVKRDDLELQKQMTSMHSFSKTVK